MCIRDSWGTTGKGITYTATRLCTNTLEHDAFGKLLKQRNIVRLGPHAHIKQFLLCGSTGKPKGVILTNDNLIATIASVTMLLKPYLNQSDSYLAYLPLAHILEFVVECYMMYYGIAIGYGRVKTLTSNSCLLYTSPSPRDATLSRMPSSA